MTERLAAADASYLAQERPEYLFGSRLAIFGGPAPGFEAFLQHARARVLGLPRLQQRVRRGALELRRPRWEHDPGFEVERHVRPARLPDPGPCSELESLSATLLSHPLDLRRPLWELWYFEGLPGGRFAAGGRVHHALGDGLGTSHLLSRLFAPEPVAAGGRDEAELTEAGLQRAEARGRRLAAAGAAVLYPARLAQRFRREARRLGLPAALALPTAPAPDTPLNRGPIDPRRSVRLLSLPLSDLRHAHRALGTTVTGLVLAALAGALRGYFDRHGWPAAEPLALVAVSLRQRGDLELGNRVRSVRCALPVTEPDPAARLQLVTDSLSRSVSAARAAGPHDDIVGPQAWRDHLTRLRHGQRRCNLIVTNSGPTAPLHCCGRQAELELPSGPNVQFQGPVVRISSYLDAVTVAITTPTGTLDDDALAAGVGAALAELQSMARAPSGGAEQATGSGWIGAPWSHSGAAAS